MLEMFNMNLVKWYFKNIDLVKFVKYNFFSENIVRDKKCYLRPYKNAVLDIDKSARIYVKGNHIDIGINKLKGSKAETYFRMGKNAVWNSNNGCCMYYNSDLEIKDYAVFTSGFFTENSGSTIICTTGITIGDNVMMGRNNLIYDSDFHSIVNGKGIPRNPNKEVTIEDNVWLTTNVIVLKGVKIERGSIVSANTTVTSNISGESIASGKSQANVVFRGVKWSRKYPGKRKKIGGV